MVKRILVTAAWVVVLTGTAWAEPRSEGYRFGAPEAPVSSVAGFAFGVEQQDLTTLLSRFLNDLYSGTLDIGNVDDVLLVREAAGHLFQRNSTNAQRASWANTYTSATNYEAFSVDWQTTANNAIVGTRTAATGTGRAVLFGAQVTNASAVIYGLRATPQTTGDSLLLGPTTTSFGAVSGAFTGNQVVVWSGVTDTNTSGTRSVFAILPTYNQSSGTAANTDLLIQRTQTAVGSGAQYLIQAGTAAATTMFTLDNTGKVTNYSNVATAGQGVQVVRATATTGTVTNSGTASIATYTTPSGSSTVYRVSCDFSITVSTTHSFSCDVTYTDDAANARTLVLPMYSTAGAQLTTNLMTNTVGAGAFTSAVMQIRADPSTAITVRTSAGGSFTTVTYTASGSITQVQ